MHKIYKDNMKGISAFIAVILIVAITVVVGGMISLFLTGFTKTQTGTIEQQTSNQTACIGAYISIDSVTDTRIFYSNPSVETISNINIVTSDGTSVNMAGGATTLTKGQTSVVSFVRGTNTSVMANGLCRDSIVVRGKCEVGQGCWD